MRATTEQVLAFRARASHLAAKLPSGSFTDAARGGLQDSIPRAGVIGLHARVENVQPIDWDDPSLCQIWFRGGADYIIPRSDIAPFTLGTLPRDEDKRRSIEDAAERVIDFLAGREVKTREVSEALFGANVREGMTIRQTSRSGRVLIRWNASTIFAYACERPEMDEEEARLELCRRFLRWFGPQPKDRFAWWTGVEPSDATQTWSALADEMVAVEVDDKPRMMLGADVDDLLTAEPIAGVRLIHNDDPWVKADRPMHLSDPTLRNRVFPPVGSSPGYIPGAVVVDGKIVGVWQRQQRKVTIHPWRRLSKVTREAIESEALSLPIASSAKARVSWAAG